MGSFVAISASPDLLAAENLYRRAVATATASGRSPTSAIQNQWSLAAAFPRENGSAFAIATDPATGSWLGVVGSCFHQAGRSDSLSLLRQYLDHGLDQLSRSLEGFFAILVGDGATREIAVITDVIGSCHLYGRQLSGAFALSSSSLLLASLEEVSLDPLACQEFLGMGIIYEDRTIYREIKKLPAASIIRFRGGLEVERRLYWDVSSLSPESISSAAATDALWQTLLSAVKKIGNQYDKIVCDLTGGYDSRAMAAAFVGADKTFATTVSGPDDSADVTVSRGLAGKLGLDHSHFVSSSPITGPELMDALQLCDGEYDLVEYATIARVHRGLSRRFHISINGSFGEVARGYWWELLVPHTGARRRLDSQKLAERRYAWRSSNDLFQPQFRMDLASHMASVIDRTVADLTGAPNTFQMDAAYLRMRMQRWQGRIASSTNRIWPCLSPFMFRSLLEVMLQTGFASRQRSLLVRKMLACYQPGIADYPLEHGYPATPATWRNLPRFWPIMPYYLGKVGQKLVPSWYASKDNATTSNPRLELWKADEVKLLFTYESMKTTSILDPSALATFLQASERADFSRGEEWNRLLSLEMALTAAAAKGL